jgi:hypothetical protein
MNGFCPRPAALIGAKPSHESIANGGLQQSDDSTELYSKYSRDTALCETSAIRMIALLIARYLTRRGRPLVSSFFYSTGRTHPKRRWGRRRPGTSSS